MGDRMTDQIPIVPKRAVPASIPPDVLAPPHAPLLMPKQVLQSDRPLFRRLWGALLVPFARFKSGARRIG